MMRSAQSDDASLLEGHESTIFVDGLQCAAAQFDADELAQLRHPDALVLKVGRDRALDHLGDVTTDTTLFLGQTRTVDFAAGADAGSSNTANACHDKKLLVLRDAENGHPPGPVKSNPDNFRVKFYNRSWRSRFNHRSTSLKISSFLASYINKW